MEKKKIIILGACGFIGTTLRAHMEKLGHNVIGFDNLTHPCGFYIQPEIVDNIRNIQDYSDIIAGMDMVYNLSANISVEKSIIMPEHTIETNFISAWKVLDICNKLNVPLIHAGTSEVFGDKDCEGKMNEKHTMLPKSPYAATKAAIDCMIHAYHFTYGTKAIVVRNYNTIGKGQADNKFGAVVSIFANRILNNLPPQIYGDGTQRRDFMSVNDAVAFYILLLEKSEKLNLYGNSYNVGMGESISINELADKMIKISGKNLKPIHVAPRPGEVKEFLCDNSKARALGWNPDTDFDKLLKEYMEWKEGCLR